MATSGVITGSKVKTLWLTFEWQRTEVDASALTSTIYWELKLNSSSSLQFSADKSYTLKVNEQDKSGTFTTNINFGENGGSEVIKSGTSKIIHNSDGTKKFNVSAVFNIAVTISGTNIESLSLAGTQTLTSIVRATKPILSTDKMQMGDELTITLNRASNAYSHKIIYNFEGMRGTIATEATTSAKWIVPRNLAEAIPDSYHGVCVIYCETYNGTKLIGSSTVNLTLTVNSKDYPSITSVNIEEVTEGIYSKFGAFIQGKSKAKITVNASGVYGSTIKGYEINFLGMTSFKNVFTTDFINVHGEVGAVIKVTDSRNRSVSTTKKIIVLPYQSPTLEVFNCFRADQSGNEDIYGTYLSIDMKFIIDSLNNKNDKLYSIEYQEQGATQWQKIVSGSVYSYDANFVSTQEILDADKQYLIKLTISDYFSNIQLLGELSSAFVLVDFHESGTGLAIGKVAEHANLFDVAFPTIFRNSVKIESEWIELTIDPAFKVFNSNVSHKPMIKNIAGHVEIKGALSPVSQFTSSATQIAMVRDIPLELRPDSDRVFLCVGSNMARWECTVKTDGTITAARYGTNEYSAVSTSSRLIFSVSYNI